MALRHLARRYQSPDMEIGGLDAEIRRLCAEANPALLAARGVCPDTASVLLVAAGDNPGRMKSERSFAALCGGSPVQASSGQTLRHRVNRGGNRQANNALWGIATSRMRTDPATKQWMRLAVHDPGRRSADRTAKHLCLDPSARVRTSRAMALCCRGELLTIQDVAVRLGQIM